MAANRFGSKIAVVLVYAAVEWVLIMMLLFNSLFYHMIKRFARFFGLKPPCLLCSSSSSQLLDCSENHHLCSCCGRNFRGDTDVVEKVEKDDNDGIIHEETLNEEPPPNESLSDAASFYLQQPAEEDEEEDYVKFVKEDDDGGTETSVSCKSDVEKQDLTTGCHEKPFDATPDAQENNDGFDAVGQLRLELESERKARRDLLAELEAERNAAAIAASQTMAMINRLQEEKAAIKTEALQYQRMMEEQAEYDQEALQLLNELVIKREKEKLDLEKDLEMYKDGMLNHEAKSVGDDSEKLSIDLNREVGEIENKEINTTGVVLDSVDMVLHRVKNWNMLDGSLEEFEQERVSILSQLKELEEKLFSVCDDNDDDDEYDDVRSIEHFLDENADLCSAEVNLCTAVGKSQPTTMAAAAKKLLPFLEEEGETEQVESVEKKIESDHRVETEDKVVAVMKEMDHVYGRLQALEADREFLRHCISSLNNGDKGIDLLGQILQHLRDLRNVDHGELTIRHEQDE